MCVQNIHEFENISGTAHKFGSHDLCSRTFQCESIENTKTFRTKKLVELKAKNNNDLAERKIGFAKKSEKITESWRTENSNHIRSYI